LTRFKPPVDVSTPVGLSPNVPERCLLYLLDRVGVREGEPATQELTQERVAQSLGIPRPHVSRAMGRLRTRGLVKIAKTHVHGGTRRRLAYFLTEAGMREAQALRRRFEEERVTVIDLEGREARRRLFEVPNLLPRRPRFSDLLASLEGDRLDLRRFHERQARLKGGMVFDVREAVAPPHFRGRAPELARLDAFLHDPRSRGLLLVGLPGIGKTALASAWAAGLRGRVHVVWRRIHPETTARELLRDLGELLRAAGRPALSAHLRGPPEGRFDAGLRLLRRDLPEVHALFVLDDAHTAGADAANLVDALLHAGAREGGLKILLLARERVGYLRADDLVRDRVWEIEVADLPEPDARSILEALGVARKRQGEILERCGGHPLSLELAAAGRLPLEGVRRMSVSWFTEEAMARLEPATRSALALASVIGGPVPLARLGPHGRELVRRCLVREVEGAKVVVHDLIREAVIQTLSPERLAGLHVRAGKILAGSEDPSEALGAVRHLLAGETWDLAEALALERGEEIIETGSSEGFLPLLDPRAWAASGAARRPRLGLLRGHALFALGRWADAARTYEECTRNPETLAEASLGLGKAEVQRRSRLALPRLLQARDQLERSGSLRRLAEAQYWIGSVHEDAGRVEESREAFERGRAVAFDAGDRHWEGLCAYGIGRLRSHQRDYEGAMLMEAEALRLLEREGTRLDIAKVCAGLGGNLLELGRMDLAEGYLARAAAEARTTGATGILASSLYNLASLRKQTGRVQEAVPLLVEALEAFEAQEQYDHAARCAAWLAFAEWKVGHSSAGDAHARRADALILRAKEPALRARALGHLGRACSQAGRLTDARRYFREAVSEAQGAKLAQLEADLTEELGKIL